MIKPLVILVLIISIVFLRYHSTETFSSIKTPKMKTYFINLKRDKERWEKVKHMGFERFEAINGKELNKDKLIASKIVSKKNRLKAGQLGCALSHIEVLKKIQRQREPYGLILEDDVIIPENFNESMITIPDTFDILFLGGCNIKGKRVADNLIKPSNDKRSYNLCLHAVLVNKNSVAKILKLLTPLYRPIDSQLRDHYDKLDVYYHYPNLINQNKELPSTRRKIDGLKQSSFWKKNHLNVYIEN